MIKIAKKEFPFCIVVKMAKVKCGEIFRFAGAWWIKGFTSDSKLHPKSGVVLDQVTMIPKNFHVGLVINREEKNTAIVTHQRLMQGM